MIRSNRFGTMQLWLPVAGIASALIYLLAFTLPAQLTVLYAIPYTRFSTVRTGDPLVQALGWIVLFALYYLGYRRCATQITRGRLATVIAFPILSSLILLFMDTYGTTDIFYYVFQGKIIAHYHQNAYLTTPGAFPDDPLLPFIFWKDLPFQYGIVWYWLSGAVTMLVGTDLLANLFAYKLLLIVHIWGSIFLVYQTLKIYKPEHTLRALYLFGWNPLLLYEIAGNGHNDIVLVFWLLMAIYWLVRGKYTVSLLALTVAILMKYIPVLLVPLFLIAFWRAQSEASARERLKRLAIALVCMGGLAAVFYLPLGIDGILASYANLSDRTQYFISSVPVIVLLIVSLLGFGLTQAQHITSNIFMLFMGVVVTWQSWVVWSKRVAIHEELVTAVVQACFTVFFAYLSIACLYFWPWYLTWLLAFAPFLVVFGYAQRMTLFCLTATAVPFTAIYYLATHQGSADVITLELVKIATIFPLPLLLSFVFWLRPRRRSLALPKAERRTVMPETE